MDSLSAFETPVIVGIWRLQTLSRFASIHSKVPIARKNLSNQVGELLRIVKLD